MVKHHELHMSYHLYMGHSFPSVKGSCHCISGIYCINHRPINHQLQFIQLHVYIYILYRVYFSWGNPSQIPIGSTVPKCRLQLLPSFHGATRKKDRRVRDHPRSGHVKYGEMQRGSIWVNYNSSPIRIKAIKGEDVPY